MNEILGNELKSILGNISLPYFIESLIDSKYPFALWRLPLQETSYVLIDITGNPPENKNIDDMDHCFIVNPYSKSHPTEPTILEGDIVIEIKNDQFDTHFSPKIAANQIEHFIKEIETGSTSKSNQPDAPILSKSNTSFKEKVKDAVKFIHDGNALKIVLSRFEDHELPKSFNLFDCYLQVKNAYPNAFCYLLSTPAHGLWFGASPEQLVSIKDNQFFKTESLAGTQLMPDHGRLSEVAWTQKEIEEQAMVSRYIINCLKKIRLREFEELGPKTVQAGQLVHLKTEYKVDMKETNTPDLGSIMLDLLHPTSAVCGMPHEEARQYIKNNEGYERELYAGFLGPVNFKHDTHLFVNLRCMQILNQSARLYAGAGITEDSDPEKEWMETVYKMKTLLDVIHLNKSSSN